MTSHTLSVESPELSATAVHEWNRHVEAVLRGVAHALNNRSAALLALIQLAGEGESSSALRAILETELDRMADLAAAIRTIGTPRAGEEAFSPADAAKEAAEVLRLHVDQRDASTPIELRDASPIRTRRWMFVRALVVLAANAGRAGADSRVEISTVGDEILVQVAGASPAPSALVEELAREMGGAALDSGRGFRLSTLSALRRREGS